MLHYFKELIKMVERKGICIYMGECKGRDDTAS